MHPGQNPAHQSSNWRLRQGFDGCQTGARRINMSCVSCGSGNQTEFASEITVHTLGLENVDNPTVMMFPKLLTCIDCGFTEFKMPENELRLLTKGPASDVEATG